MFRIRPKRKTMKGKITPLRKSNHYVSSRDAFAAGQRNVPHCVERNDSHIINSGNLKARFATASLNDRPDTLQRDKHTRSTHSVYYKADNESMATYAMIKDKNSPGSLVTDDNAEMCYKPQFEARFPSPLGEMGQNFRNSYIDSKMTFLSKNPIYDMSDYNW